MPAADYPHLGLRIAYDGKPFSGFQLQKNSRSIQGEIERALQILFRRKIRISFTSRTDAGVHAYDQWVFLRSGFKNYFSKLNKKESERFLISLNAILPKEISVWQVLRLRSDFHPKKNVSWKEYEYRVLQGLAQDPLEIHLYWWIRRELSIPKMKSAAALLVGKHRFSGFAKLRSVRKDRAQGVRRILKIQILVRRHPTMEGVKSIRLIFRGEGFLHQMVRRMVGTIVEIGSGKTLNILEILNTDQMHSVFNAPPNGLVLTRSHIEKKFFRVLLRA